MNYFAVTQTPRYWKGKRQTTTQWHEFETEAQMLKFVETTTKNVVEYGRKSNS